MGLIGLMMLTSAVTVYLIRPEIRRTMNDVDPLRQDHSNTLMHRLVRGLGINPVLGLGVLLATSVMFYYPVPPGLSPAGPSSYTVHGGGFTATLAVKPDRSGLNTFTVLLQDTHGRPVQQAHITVLTTMLDMVMGTGLAQLTEGAPGHFSGSTDLGMGGNWRLTMLIYTPSGFTRLPVKIRVGT
jgi:hypothetical protein